MNELLLDASAQDEDDFIIYDIDTGALSYEADGSGEADPVQVALLGNHPLLTPGDFLIA